MTIEQAYQRLLDAQQDTSFETAEHRSALEAREKLKAQRNSIRKRYPKTY